MGLKRKICSFLLFIFLLNPLEIFLNRLESDELDVLNSSDKEELNIDNNYLLGPGDVIDIIFFGAEEFSGRYTILKDGFLYLPVVGSINLSEISIVERARLRSVMSQSQPIIFDFTVSQVIEMGWVERGLSNYVEEFHQAVIKTAKECFVFDLLEDRFSNLSGGEQRRVHFARTLLQLWRPSGSQDPRYLILDEPTANIDLFFEREILNLLRKKANECFGCLIVLHDLNLAAKFSDKMALLHNGVIVRFGNHKEILSSEILSEIYHLEITISENPFRINYY